MLVPSAEASPDAAIVTSAQHYQISAVPAERTRDRRLLQIGIGQPSGLRRVALRGLATLGDASQQQAPLRGPILGRRVRVPRRPWARRSAATTVWLR